MSNTFNIQRFGKLLKKHSVDHFKGYLLSSFVLMGILSISYSFLLYNQGNMIGYSQRFIIFYMFFLFSGVIFTSNIFIDYSTKERAIANLTLPASHLEKFLIAWIYSFLIFSIIFIACFYIADTLFVKNSMLPEKEKPIFNLFINRAYYSFYGYAFFHSICFYGAFYFRKMHFIKTAFTVFAIVIIMVLIHREVLKSLIPGHLFGQTPFSGFAIRDKTGNYQNVWLEQDIQYAYIRYTLLLIPLFLWSATYFQMKEKQV